ncbi:hypothetical protein C8R44DRAFT_870758 [Mycena epipterygia]|nr:hypothetical protein C8R44DRAFT_870758 [Mycena epipterygia]
MSHWLLRPQFSFTFSHLKSIETNAHTWCALQEVLQVASSLPVIESLILTDFSLTKTLDLSTLPALRLLDFSTQPSSAHYSAFLFTLQRVPKRCLDIIAIRFTVYAEDMSHSFDGCSLPAVYRFRPFKAQ